MLSPTLSVQDDLLPMTLAVAVPQAIADLQQLQGDTRTEQMMAWAQAAVEPVASRADTLMFGGGRKGDAARTFAHLARGLAALAHAPGGVLFAGWHWCVEHPMGVRCASITDLSCVGSGLDSEPASTPPAVVTVTTTGVL